MQKIHQSVVLCLLALLTSLSTEAKKKENPLVKRTTAEAGITLSTNGNLTATAISANQYWGVGKKKGNFKFGLGARLTSSFGGSDLTYMTAPAILTSGKTGPGVFFADQIPANIDTLKLSNTQVNSLNLYLALRYDFLKKWGIEFNIDLTGISFGKNQNGVLAYGETNNATKNVNAKPTFGNALLVSDNDLGSLNSEFIISYKLKKDFKIKAGASFIFNEYSVDNPVVYTNSIGTVVGTDRYRAKALTFGLGINYIFHSKK